MREEVLTARKRVISIKPSSSGSSSLNVSIASSLVDLEAIKSTNWTMLMVVYTREERGGMGYGKGRNKRKAFTSPRSTRDFNHFISGSLKRDKTFPGGSLEESQTK